MSADILHFGTMEHAPNRIRYLRTTAAMTQQDLADHLSVSKMTISDLERGEVALTLDKMRQIARVFKIAPAQVLNEGDHAIFLDAQESDLIARFRAADKTQRALISRLAAPIVDSDDGSESDDEHSVIFGQFPVKNPN